MDFKIKSIALGVALTAASSAWATNGYFAHGYGTKSKGMAGAGVALSQDSMAAATNPAGMAFVGDRMDLGISLFSPRREYSVSGNPSGGAGTFPLEPGTVESDNEYFPIPHFGWNKMLDADSSIGVSVYGNGGMNTAYPSHANPVRGCGPTGTFCAGKTGVDLVQVFIAPTYARKFNADSAWGITPILAVQRFKANGVLAFGAFSSDAANLSNNGYEWSYGGGVKLGVQGQVTPSLRLGASFQSRIYMTEFDKYAGLFAEQGDFDVPPTATIGLAFQTSPSTTLVFDIQHIWYSDVNSIGNPLFPNLGTALLGNDNGAGFGWDDMTIFKLGYQWQSSPDWTWRVGYSYGEQPIPKSEVVFNILAPAVIEQHITFGFTKQMGSNNELNFAAMYAPSSTVSGGNPLEAPGQQKIELKMQQFELELSYAWKF
jgi:long-chain fatty acid transport protein